MQAFGNLNDSAQAELIEQLEKKIPSLKPRGARLLHASLRARLLDLADEDDDLAREQLDTRFLDEVLLTVCEPFVQELVVSCGPRPGLDASHVAANVATMAGGTRLLGEMIGAGYALHRAGSPGAFARCLTCPQCCLHDGVKPTGNGAMPFSAQHAAAAAGQRDVLEWLEREQASSYHGARDVLFDIERFQAAVGGSDATEAETDGGGWSARAGELAEGRAEGRTEVNAADAADAVGAAGALACEVHTVSGEEVTRDPTGFFERYVRAAQPVMIRGLLDVDPAMALARRSLRRDALLERLGDTVWEVGRIPYEARYTDTAPSPLNLSTFVTRHIDECDTAPALESLPATCSYHYVFAERFWREGEPAAVKAERLVPVPGWARTKRLTTAKGTQFYLGPARSGAPMHFHQAAYNVLVFGRKLWYLTPPSHSVFSMRPAHEWIQHRLPAALAKGKPVYRCEQGAGDVLVLPDLWGHLTVNLATSVGIAQEFMWS